jgi:Putative Actinobacterial Holin-X, holin superfamily III
VFTGNTRPTKRWVMNQQTHAGTAAAAGHSDTGDQDRPAQDRSIGELARQLPDQISKLVRDELRLARLEMTQKGKRAGLGVGMLGGGGVVALYGAAAIIAAIILLIAKVMPAWASALIVGGALLAGAAALAQFGRMQVRRATPPIPEQAAGSVRSDIDEIKERAHR